MDNWTPPAPSGSNTASGGVHVPDSESRIEVEAQHNDSASNKHNVVAENKRKKAESKSKAWEHFEKLKDEKGRTQKAKYIYYAKTIFCYSKIHGTSSLRNYMLSCKKNPHSKDTRQALFNL